MSSSEPSKLPATEEILVPEFGALNADLLATGKSYSCHTYPMTPEAAQAVSEHTAFTARFDSANMRSATMDLWGSQAKAVIEIERHSKPKEIAVRYPRERWNVLEAHTRGAEGAGPSIRTEYGAQVLGPKVFDGVAAALGLPADLIHDVIVRINFKAKKFYVVVDSTLTAQMPAGAENRVPILRAGESESTESAVEATAIEEELADVDAAPATGDPATEDPATEEPPDPKPAQNQSLSENGYFKSFSGTADSSPETSAPDTTSSQRSEMEPKQKYATYSRSEVDQLLKQQSEQLAGTLSTKMSQQQRAFQEAIEKQEKAFAKLSDSFIASLENARMKLEGTARGANEETKAELEEFKRQLGKELEAYRAQISKVGEKSKTTGAIAQTKPEKQEKVAAPPSPPSPVVGPAGAVMPGGRDQVVMGLLVASIVAAMVNMVTIMLSVGDVKQQLIEVEKRLPAAVSSAPTLPSQTLRSTGKIDTTALPSAPTAPATTPSTSTQTSTSTSTSP